jgi:hypothetical protein
VRSVGRCAPPQCASAIRSRHAPAPAPTNIPSRRQSHWSDCSLCFRGSTSQHAILPKLLRLASTSNPVSQNGCLDVNSRKGKTKATRRTTTKKESRSRGDMSELDVALALASCLQPGPVRAPAAANRREPTTGRLLQFTAARMPPYSRIFVNDNDTSSDQSELNATTENQRL